MISDMLMDFAPQKEAIFNEPSKRMASAIERKAVAYFANIDLSALQKALTILKEEPLDTATAKLFWKKKVEDDLRYGNLMRIKRRYLWQTRELEQNPEPEKYAKSFVDEGAMEYVRSVWKQQAVLNKLALKTNC